VNDNNSILSLIVIIVCGVSCLIILYKFSRPKTDPGVTLLNGNQALLHDGEQLVLLVPVDEYYERVFTLSYLEGILTIRDDHLYEKRESFTEENCVSFSVEFLKVIDVCKTTEGIVVEWSSGIWPN